MRIARDRSGVLLIPFVLVLLVIGVVAGAVLFKMNVSEKRFMSSVEDVQKAIYLAEEGLALAYAELREQGVDWFNYQIGPDGETLVPRILAQIPNPRIKGAQLDPTTRDYLPLGDDRVRVRVYKDEDDNIWAVSRAEVNGVVRIVRASMVYGSLLEFFHFYNRGHVFGGDVRFDGKGMGKIYVNGNIKFNGRVYFIDVPMLSTNSAGRIYVQTDNKRPPYVGDHHIFDARDNSVKQNDEELDGLAYFPMINDEFYTGYSSWKYYYSHGSGDEHEASIGAWWEEWWPSRLLGLGAKRAWGWAEFQFHKDVMGDKIDLGDKDFARVRTPTRVYDQSGSPVNYKFDIYKGKDHDEVGGEEGEKAVRYVRLFRVARDENGNVKTDENGNILWEFVSNPANADVAEVFDAKQTAIGLVIPDVDGKGVTVVSDNKISMKYIDENGNVQSREIPVYEGAKRVIYNQPVYTKDENGNKVLDHYIPHEVVYDVHKEKQLWARMFGKDHYNDIPEKMRQYIENGYTRDDAEFPEFGYPEYDGFNALNTGFGPHAQRFKDWIEGNYAPNLPKKDDESDEDYKLRTGTNDSLDLTGIVKEGSTGAVTLEPIELKETIPYEAKERGVWIGYEKGADGNQHLRVYVGGSMIYEEGTSDPENWPTWLQVDNFITGNTTKGEKRVTAYTIDIQKLNESIPNIDEDINGVIWINVKPPGGDKSYDRAVRIVHGETIPRDGGLTIATPQSVMIQGDLNYQHGADEQDYQPVAIITDSDVYVLSKDFTPPEYVPAYGGPVGPSNGWYNYLRDEVKKRVGLSKGENFWPDPNKDSDARYNAKLEAIRQAVKDFYNSKISDRDRKYGAPYMPDLEDYLDHQFDPSKENWDDIASKIDSIFKQSRNPLTAHKVEVDTDGDGEPDTTEWVTDHGLVPAMVAVKDDADNREVRINAAIVSSEPRGDSIKFIENWSWFGGDEYTYPASVRIEGMFPHVVSKDWIDGGNRWSYDYNKANFTGSINANIPPTYVAHDYSNDPPPGDLSYVGLSAYFVERDPSMFGKHPY